jgi:hypothetical protein
VALFNVSGLDVWSSYLTLKEDEENGLLFKACEDNIAKLVFKESVNLHFVIVVNGLQGLVGSASMSERVFDSANKTLIELRPMH